MCITIEQINELNNVIEYLNSIANENQKKNYLENHVEDVDLFLNTLNKINKRNLNYSKKKKDSQKKSTFVTSYKREEVFNIFSNQSIDEIIKNTSKAELSAMYYAVYHAKPLSADNKERIAQTINGHIQDMSRAKVLLG